MLSSSELLYFSCESEKDRDNWVTAIRGAIDSLDERFFNSFREEFHSLINHKSRRGKLAIYIPNPEVDENSMRLNWYFSLCELQEDNSLKVFATVRNFSYYILDSYQLFYFLILSYIFLTSCKNLK